MTPHRARTLTTIPDLAELNAPCEHSPVVIDGPTIVYGKGELGAMAMDYLRAINRPAFHQIDADWLAAVPRIPGPMLDSLVLVAVARWPYVSIEQALTDHGFTNVAPFLDMTPNHPEHPLANGWFADPLDLDRVQTVLDMFADDVSRAHYVQFLAWRRLREEWTFEGAPVDVDGPRYWPVEVASVLGNQEVFVDGGSHHGQTSAAFVSRFGGVVWGFEADPENFIHKDQAFMAIRVALDQESGFAPWWGGFGYASRISEKGLSIHKPMSEQWVSCAPLDQFGLNPTFIKLHLEGGELEALRGARRTIETHRPILAVTTYHNSDGMTDIPLWLAEHCSDYRFLWRNSAYVGESAVMFAIPNERGSC